MAFSNQVQHGFAGLEENLNLPTFSINTDDFFLRKSRIRTDKSKPVLAVRFVPYAYDFRRNWSFFSYHNINRQQIFWSAMALFVLGIDFFDTQLFTTVWVFNPAALLDHSNHIHAFWMDGCDLHRVWKPGIKQNIVSIQSHAEGSVQQSHHCFWSFCLSKLASFSCKGSVIKVLYRTDDICSFCRCQQTAVYRNQCISITPA